MRKAGIGIASTRQFLSDYRARFVLLVEALARRNGDEPETGGERRLRAPQGFGIS